MAMTTDKKGGVCVVKTVYEKPGSPADIRRFNIGTEATERTFEKLVEFIRSSYGHLTDRSFFVKYVDDEGDVVTISNTMEFVEALNCSSGDSRTLKLIVGHADAKTECAEQVKSASSVGAAAFSTTASVPCAAPPPIQNEDTTDHFRGLREDTGVLEVVMCLRRLLSEADVRNELVGLVHSFLDAVVKGDHVKTAMDTAVASCSSSLRNNSAFTRLLALERLWLPYLERVAACSPECIAWIQSMLPLCVSMLSEQLAGGLSEAAAGEACGSCPLDLSALLSSMCGSSCGGVRTPGKAACCGTAGDATCGKSSCSAADYKSAGACADNVVHTNVTCDCCGASPITGVRFKCTVCSDFDLCAGCESSGRHDKCHPLIKMSVPHSSSLPSPPHMPAAMPGVHFPPMPPAMSAGMAGGPFATAWCSGPHMWSMHGGAPPVRQMCRQWARAMRCCQRGGGVSGGCGQPWWRAGDESGSDSGHTAESAVRRYESRVLCHLTLLDRCAVLCGQTVVKTWRMANSGRVAWPAGAKLIFVRGDRELLGAQEQFPVPAVAAGDSVDVSAVLQTPQLSSAKRMVAYFRLADQNGVPFGCRLWADVMVTPNTAADLRASGAGTSNVADASLSTAGEASAASSVAGSSACSAEVTSTAKFTSENGGNMENQLRVLESMGFKSRDLNTALLAQHGGNLQQTVSALVELMKA